MQLQTQCDARKPKQISKKINFQTQKIKKKYTRKICYQHRPCGPQFPHVKNFLATIRCTKPFFNVLTRDWQNLIEIHLTDPAIWPKTCNHVAEFLFDQNFASTPRRRKYCLFDSSTQNKESSLQATSEPIKNWKKMKIQILRHEHQPCTTHVPP